MFIRQATSGIVEALTFMRIVAMTGPRQSGKSTLARQIAGQGAVYRSLDEPDLLSFARTDPVGFLDVGERRLVIDEIQRAPQLILPMKAVVDLNTRPCQFLITGSADLTALSTVQDALTGRMARKTLLPLAQVELAGKSAKFFDAIFSNEVLKSPADDRPIEQVVATGGFPEAVSLPVAPRRQWFEAYGALTAQHDIADIADFERADLLPNLIAQLALRTSGTLNISDLSKTLQLARATIDSYISALEALYIVRRVQPWSRNEISRLAKTPKIHFLDSGLVAALCRYSPGSIEQRAVFGPLLKTFVFAELSKLASFHSDPPVIYHLRSLAGEEVDFILETWDRKIVAIEVKANATVNYDWFKTMRTLRDTLGPAFVQGIVLYTGKQVKQFDDRMVAAPVSCLWSD